VFVVVVMCGTSDFVRQFIMSAHSFGMTNGDYVYIVLNQMPPDNLKTPWIDNVSTDALARDAFSFVLQVYASQSIHNFILELCIILVFIMYMY